MAAPTPTLHHRTSAGHAWPPRGRLGQRGLSIVELMVGITISLFILAGATLVLTTQLGNNRRLLLEAQLQQDLRTAADMITRDVRRAGYWGKAYCNISASSSAPTCPLGGNRYTTMTPSTAPGGTSQLEYDRSTDEEGGVVIGTDDDELDGDDNRPREHVGFKWNNAAGTIDYLAGANWQALTDATVMRVTQFTMVINAQDLPVPCGQPGCQTLGPNGCPLTLRSRDITFTIVAQALHDVAVQRSVRENVRLRNSLPFEICPGP